MTPENNQNSTANKSKSSELQHLPNEIERKFLIDEVPFDIEEYPKANISQGYLSVGNDGTEVRLRKQDDKYYQTVKRGEGMIRTEIEIEIDERQFNDLWGLTSEKRLNKTRYFIPFKGTMIELDIYKDNSQGLKIAEIEFNDVNASNSFVPPEWFGEEVTFDERYKNKNIATSTKVEESKNNNIAKYPLEEGIAEVVDFIKKQLLNSDTNIVVEIAGGSASGKTSTVSNKIKEIFGDEAIIVSADDYYRGKSFMEEQQKKGINLSWDQPEALDMELFSHHLESLKRGDQIDKPEYDMKANEPIGTKLVMPKKIIIAEGLFVLDPSLKNNADLKVFVEIGIHGRIIRRLLRDIHRTGQKPVDILKYFAEVVQPMHDRYVEETKHNADIIIENEYSPKIEAELSGLHEIQSKIKGELSEEDITRLGVRKLSKAMQVDKYYNPADRNLMQTGEILRIREEGGRKIFTYKGPVSSEEIRKRPIFEFEIDSESEKAFLGIYGDKIKTIIKERTLCELEGVLFSIDKVMKQVDGVDSDVGNFVEIRLPDSQHNRNLVLWLCDRLKLDPAQITNSSYFEM